MTTAPVLRLAGLVTSVALAAFLTSATPDAARAADTSDATPASTLPTDYDMSARERSQNAEPAPPPTLPMLPLAPAVPPTATGEQASPSIFTRWWFWTAIGIAVVGSIVAGVALQPRDPGCPRDATCL